MRRGEKPSIVRTDDGLVAGVTFGSDFCAEHEWGIQHIRDEFGIVDDIAIYGMAKRKINRVSEDLFWFDQDKKSGFGCAYYYKDGTANVIHNSELRLWTGQRLSAAWDEKTFAVLTTDPDKATALKEIYDNFAKLNIIIMLGGKTAWLENPGLLIGIADRMPQITVKMWEDFDKNHHEITLEFDKTGIKNLLAEKGRRYFALSPKRDKDGSLIFWLNPMEQQKNNCGWFKLQDLQDWAEGKGKIPMKEAK